jgi:CRP/FNR family transcriptional regulator, nitrogen oxide reductase regulator
LFLCPSNRSLKKVFLFNYLPALCPRAILATQVHFIFTMTSTHLLLGVAHRKKIFRRRLHPVSEKAVPELFRDLDDVAVGLILKAAQRCSRDRGEVFCRQGERTTNLYLLTDGLVKVGATTNSGKEVLLDWIKPEEGFGLGALLSPPAENVWTIYAATRSVALEWDAETIHCFAQSYPKFYRSALAIALRWTRQLQQRFEELSTEKVEQRLARLVLFLAKRFATKEPAEVRTSDIELAQMTGTNLFTVNKLVHSWQRLGYVNKSRGRLLLVDSEGLLTIAGSSG